MGKIGKIVTRQCLVQDDSGHWYCINVPEKEDFEAWMRGEIKVMNEMGFAGGPLSYHFQGNDERKATTPAWMRGMEKTHGRH